MLTTSPAIIASPCPSRASSSTIASPVFTATLTSSPSSPGPVADGECRADRPLVVVPEGLGRAEDTHHRVADELLDPAAEALELGANAPVVRRQDRAHVLGIQARSG